MYAEDEDAIRIIFERILKKFVKELFVALDKLSDLSSKEAQVGLKNILDLNVRYSLCFLAINSLVAEVITFILVFLISLYKTEGRKSLCLLWYQSTTCVLDNSESKKV
jgi:hypothetical protein